MRGGYSSEYRIKKELQEIWGRYNVVKVAISQMGSDFLIVSCGELIKLVEVKETKQKKKYFNKREREQLEEIKRFAKSHHIPAELVVVFRRGKGKPIIKDYVSIYEPKLR